MPKHIVRLILSFVVIIGLFFVAKHFLTPESYGDLGRFRANSIGEISALETKYIGDDVCADCHTEVATLKASGTHKGIACETCHGPGYLHMDNPDTVEMPKGSDRDFCTRCHAKMVARSKYIKQIDPKEHNVDDNCIDCHNPHEPWN